MRVLKDLNELKHVRDTHVLIILNAYLKPLNPFIVVRRDSYNSTPNSGVSCDFALWQLGLWNLAGVGRKSLTLKG